MRCGSLLSEKHSIAQLEGVKLKLERDEVELGVEVEVEIGEVYWRL